jgi:hypothetical protein
VVTANARYFAAIRTVRPFALTVVRRDRRRLRGQPTRQRRPGGADRVGRVRRTAGAGGGRMRFDRITFDPGVMG